jgi:hypothetical protein
MTVFKVGTTIKNFITGINANFAELSNKLTHKPISYKVLYSGSTTIPSNDSGNTATITLNDSITNFDGVIIQREGSSCWQTIETISVGSKFKVMNCEADFEYMEGCNLYMCNAEVVSATQLKVNNNVYAGIKTSAAGRYLTSFTDRPITKVIGIKLN